MVCNSLLMNVVLPWCNLETIREYLKVLELVPFKYLECRRVKINLIKNFLLLEHFDLDPNKSLNISHTSRLEFKHQSNRNGFSCQLETFHNLFLKTNYQKQQPKLQTFYDKYWRAQSVSKLPKSIFFMSKNQFLATEWNSIQSILS